MSRTSTIDDSRFARVVLCYAGERAVFHWQHRQAGRAERTGGGRGEVRRLGRLGARFAPGLVATLLVLALAFADPPTIRQLGNMVFDGYQQLRPRPYQPVPVRVVDIDDETIRRLGQWPWPRTEVARLTQRLADAGASAIAFDIVFSEPDRTSPARLAAILRENPDAHGDYREIARLADHDTLFARTLAGTPAVTGFFLTRDGNAARPVPHAGMAFAGTPPTAGVPDFGGAIVPLPELGRAASGSGFVSLLGDGDGIIRRAPLLSRIGGEVVPSLSLEALRVAQGAGAIVIKSSDASGELGGGAPEAVGLKVGAFEVPTTKAGELWMYYTGPVPGRIVPAWKILEGRLPAAALRRLFEGDIVFVGTGAAGLRDLVSTPQSDRELGVVVHAEAVEQMILGRFLSRPDWAPGLERAAVLAIGLLLMLVLPLVGAGAGAALGALMVGGALGGSWLAFGRYGLLVDPTYPLLSGVTVYLTVTAAAFWREERARAGIHRAFDRYLSPDLVKRIAADPSQVTLGGEVRDMTVLFCDIRGFSHLSESMAPDRTIAFLIDFLTPMTDILLAARATIDKYIGDAILAFWNAPLDDPDHPRHAASAALAMIARLERLNEEKLGRDPGWPGLVKIGVGMNTGPCCVGNMGSAQRLSYSLIGDTVNLASRLEGQTKYYGVPILIGDEMAERLSGAAERGGRLGHDASSVPESSTFVKQKEPVGFALIEVDLLKVVGRDRAERLHAILGDGARAAEPGFRRLADRHARLLAAYRAQDWDQAETLVAETRGDREAAVLARLMELYLARIEAFRAAPPPPGWDGVHHATAK